MYGFKYWIIGKEVNTLLGDEDVNEDQQDFLDEYWTEERYKRISKVGIFVNVIACCTLGVVRAFANVSLLDQDW
jgi:hypothetical protein